MARNFYGLRIQCAAPQRSTVQRNESRLSDVETTSGGVDGNEINKPVRRPVRQLPAAAAVGGAKFGVESSAKIWEVGEVLEMWEPSGETVWPV